MRVMNASRSLFLILYLRRKTVRRRITRTTRASLLQFLVGGKVARQRRMLQGKLSSRKTWRNLISMSTLFSSMTATRSTSSDSPISNYLDFSSVLSAVAAQRKKSLYSVAAWLLFWSCCLLYTPCGNTCVLITLHSFLLISHLLGFRCL